MKTSTPSLNRQILALAVPAFGALIAEPLFVMADSAIIGHLGTPQLAGLTLGSTVVQTIVGLAVFLSYSTTPAVARAFGSGDLKRAYTAGRDGLVTALMLGVLVAGALWLTAPGLITALGGTGEMHTFGVDYLRWSLPGLPAMLAVLAAVGVLRGMQDTKTPLYVATGGAVLNAGLNWVLVYPAGMGVAGSALGTSAVQWLMALVLGAMVVRGMRAHHVSALPGITGVAGVLRVGSWLMLRTLSMRIALLATVFVVTAQGAENLAAYQLVLTFFNFLAFALDSLAIAAQALLGKELGARNLDRPAERDAVVVLKDRLVRWALGFGLVTALLCPLVGFFAAPLFTSDSQVQHLFALAMLVVAVGQPLASYVFILDGVLIGAQDVRYLALASLLNAVVYLPMLVAVYLIFSGSASVAGFIWLWVSYALGYMGIRALTLGHRARQGVWIK
ncbi:MATE family efflux transporter [Rothia sp. ZJ932]|uniref:MATE family efflux transporter n=1 Tax=Rothia sp. ZJ932 TaxID=2810516 RepID=UPI001F088347|nr:MATE family efflux transporter [Rothia sp. ZJ932]